MSPVTTEPLSLSITFGVDASGVFDPGLPVLGGEAVENLFSSARPAGRAGVLTFFQADGWLLGAATVPLLASLEDAARQLYEDIFAATRGQHLARIWNYVPSINQVGTDGLENYGAFCRGRSLAFEQYHGSGFKAELPAASAVGSKSEALTVVFAACAAPARHLENPLQMAAYDYPTEHGPRAPSFARATIVPGAERDTVFISGTAAIRGHATVAPNLLRLQLECTLENLAEISNVCGLGPDLDRGGRSTRHFKVYLRSAADQSAVAAILAERLFVSADHVSYLQADLCRSSLVVEIEASLFGVAAGR